MYRKPMIHFAILFGLAIQICKAQVAPITVDCGKILMKLPRTERSWTTIKTVKGPKDRDLLKALKPEYIRMFNLGHTSDEDAEAKALGASPVVCMSTVKGNDCGSFNPTTYEAHARKFLKDAKTQHPNLEFVEVENEPDANCKMNKDEYWKALAIAAKVAEEINSTLPAGQPRIKVGGPTITGIDSPQLSWITGMLDEVKKNDIPLGFVGYHQYVPTPKRHFDNIVQVSKWLAERNMEQLPQLNTEWQYDWQNPKDSKVNAAVLAYVAAYTMASHYYYALGERVVGKRMIPFSFATNDYVNAHRSLVIASQTDGTDGTITPQYNIRQMQSMMKNHWVDAEGAQLDANGYGLGAMASMDSTGVAVLMWNTFNECVSYTGGRCRQTAVAHKKTYEVALTLANLPAQSRSRSAITRTYLVDETHSNYAHDKAKQNLEMIEQKEGEVASFDQKRFTLKPNSVILFTMDLLISTAAATEAYGALPNRHGNLMAGRTIAGKIWIEHGLREPVRLLLNSLDGRSQGSWIRTRESVSEIAAPMRGHGMRILTVQGSLSEVSVMVSGIR